jgi:hypothetical protein
VLVRILLAAAVWVLGAGVAVALPFAFLSVSPLVEISSGYGCDAGQVIVEETQVGGGVAPTRTRMCCARPDDPRKFGRCDWSSSMDPKELGIYVPGLVAAGIVAVLSGVVGLLLLLSGLRMRRRRPAG